MIHERPGVWSAFGAQGTTELTDRRLAAVIAPADAAEGVQLVHSAAEAVSLYGGNALLTRMLKLCLANCGDPVYAVAVDEDTKVAYETALTALFAAAKPGILIVGSAREDVQLLLRETAEANECLGVAGMKGASADALVARVIAGVILGALGIYKRIEEFGGCGATVPLSGFGFSLWKGMKEAVDNHGFLGLFEGGFTAAAVGTSAALIFSYLASLIFQPKIKK